MYTRSVRGALSVTRKRPRGVGLEARDDAHVAAGDPAGDADLLQRRPERARDAPGERDLARPGRAHRGDDHAPFELEVQRALVGDPGLVARAVRVPDGARRQRQRRREQAALGHLQPRGRAAVPARDDLDRAPGEAARVGGALQSHAVAALDDVDQRHPARRAPEAERRRGHRAATHAGGVHARLADDRAEHGRPGEREIHLHRAAGQLVARADLRAGRDLHARREAGTSTLGSVSRIGLSVACSRRGRRSARAPCRRRCPRGRSTASRAPAASARSARWWRASRRARRASRAATRRPGRGCRRGSARSPPR